MSVVHNTFRVATAEDRRADAIYTTAIGDAGGNPYMALRRVAAALAASEGELNELGREWGALKREQFLRA